MGKIKVNIEIANYSDEILAKNNVISYKKVRKILVNDVLVDTGATTLCLPKNILEQLGVIKLRKVVVNTTTGDYVSLIYGDVKLSLLGRSSVIECIELPAGRTPLLGVIPMEIMGLEVDVVKHKLKLLPDFDAGTYLLAL